MKIHLIYKLMHACGVSYLQVNLMPCLYHNKTARMLFSLYDNLTIIYISTERLLSLYG